MRLSFTYGFTHCSVRLCRRPRVIALNMLKSLTHKDVKKKLEDISHTTSWYMVTWRNMDTLTIIDNTMKKYNYDGVAIQIRCLEVWIELKFHKFVFTIAYT